jgi:hypothetical protein
MPSKPQTSQPELWLSSASEVSTAQALAPSLDGFGDLYRQHVVAIYRYHHARTGCVADAQDPPAAS